VNRLITRLLIVVAVLAVVIVGADRAAARTATRSVAKEVQQSQKLTQPVDVSIPGVPFLTQAVSGRYDTVKITMRGLPVASGLVVDQLDATLHGVHAPLSEALSGGLTSLSVDSGDAVAQISFASMEAAAKQSLSATGVTMTFGRATADRVSVAAQVDSLLGSFSITGQAQLSVSGGRLGVKILPNTLSGLPAELRDEVASQVDLSALSPQLPFGFVAQSVTVDSAGLQLRAGGTALTIS
jgi:LmeA-like phospholipid-binding